MWAGLIAGPLATARPALGLAPLAGGALGMTVVVAGVGLQAAAAPTLSSRLRTTGAVVCALQLLTLPGLVAGSGPFAPAAVVPVVAFWALTAWSMTIAFQLRRA